MQLWVKDRADLTKADAVRYAYRLLSYRDRSDKELRERLQRKGFPEEAVHQAMSHLAEKGFINDSALAVSLKRIAEDVKLLGKQGVPQFLRQRGLSEEIIKDICTDTDHEEITRAQKLADKKLRTMQNYAAEEIRKKLWRFLLRKGYSFDTIMKILKQFKIKEEEA